jgi:hypothetical protein
MDCINVPWTNLATLAWSSAANNLSVPGLDKGRQLSSGTPGFCFALLYDYIGMQGEIYAVSFAGHFVRSEKNFTSSQSNQDYRRAISNTAKLLWVK